MFLTKKSELVSLKNKKLQSIVISFPTFSSKNTSNYNQKKLKFNNKIFLSKDNIWVIFKGEHPSRVNLGHLTQIKFQRVGYLMLFRPNPPGIRH